MLKDIALTLFAVVMGMSWIILVKDKEVEYGIAAIPIENINYFEDDDDEESHLDHDYFEDQEVISS
jgi:membrane-associated protease RseP (regulator of RpoE activity)